MTQGNAASNTAMLLTPPGSAAIAVVRLDGPGVEGFLRRHFSRSCEPTRCVHGELVDDAVVLDDPLVIVAEHRRSAEVHLHGGPWVVASTIELLRRCGFGIIGPCLGMPLDLEHVDGETLLHREIQAHLPLARTLWGIRLLLAQANAWESFLRDNLDPSPGRIGDLRPMLFPPRVAIVGAPNVGKSTLANQLFARERSITANLPGTTRDWVGALANLDGLPVMLVDTPGLRQTDDPIERAAINRSASVIRRAELVIEVIDASAPIPPTWPGALVVMNKSDRSIGYGVPGALRIVAITGDGVDAVRDAVRSQFDFARLDLDRPMVWTDRHRSILERAREAPAVLRKIIE